MTHLYIVRHGTARDAEAGEPDASRTLTAEGVREIETVARGLKRLKVEVDRVVTSPLPRARRTAEIIAGALKLGDRLEVADVLSTGSSCDRIREWLATRSEARLMLVGHNPGLNRLVGMLIGLPHVEDAFPLKKGAVVALRSGPQGGFELRWTFTPKVVERLID